jgi:hypothetical protein
MCFLINLEFYAIHLLQNTVQIHRASYCGGGGGSVDDGGGGGGGCGDGDEFQIISPYSSHKFFILDIK